MKRGLNRRTVLRGLFNTVIGLPLLEYMLDDSGTAFAQGGALPRRYFLQHCPSSLVTSGSRVDAMTPTRAGFGYDAPLVLQPLESHGLLGDVSVVSGLFAPPLNAPGGYNVDYHGQATFAHLTGLRSGFSGVRWRPQGYSADQLLAAQWRGQTRLPYLYFQVDPVAGGSICYEQTQGFSDEPPIVYREMTPQVSPALAYRAMFAGFTPPSGMVDPQAELERRLRQSSLSYARESIAAFQKKLGAADRRTLDEHLTHVRALEERLSVSMGVPTGASCSDPRTPASDPAALATDLPNQEARATLFAELIRVAFACDMTRIISFAGSGTFTGPGMRHQRWNTIGGLHGEVQHASTQANLNNALQWFVDVYARVLDGLKSTAEGAGSILDQTAALFVMEGGKGLASDPQRSGDGGGDPNHSCDNMVSLLAGRAGGLRAGQHLNLRGQDLHPSTVINTAMRAVGVDARLGEVTGTIDGLF